jgi:DDE superfamily endonuclease
VLQGQRCVTRLHALGQHARSLSGYYRFLSDGKVRAEVLSRTLVELIVRTFHPSKLEVVVDNTLCPKWGRKIFGTGTYYDHVSRPRPGYLWGHNWVVLSIIVDIWRRRPPGDDSPRRTKALPPFRDDGQPRSSEMSLSRCCLGIGWTVIACGTASSQATTRVSVNSRGVQGNGHSYAYSISADGRYVVFDSYATNLVPRDYNHREDVFVHDRVTGMTERVNVDSNGVEANDDSWGGPISADGRFVAFFSWAGNLVPGDTNNTGDVFLRDRVTGKTELISVDPNGGPGDGPSFFSSISADGRYVAFDSTASNLVRADTNDVGDIFVRDRQLGQTELVSLDSSRNQGNGGSGFPSISADGAIVAFYSEATNLVS